MPFKQSPYKEECIEALKAGELEGIKPDELIDQISKRFPVSKKTVERYYNSLKEPKAIKEKEGGNIATFVAKQPAPVIFRLGERQIELEPEAIYESFLLYEDIKLRTGLDGTFSTGIRDGMALLWRILASEPLVQEGKVKQEVNYVGISGHGKDQGRVE